jgi:hypothetical protein
MNTNKMVAKLFESIDQRNISEFLSFLTNDVLFKFGNAEPVNGKANLGNMLEDFYKSIKAISNGIQDIWEQDGVIICRGIVTYTRHDNSVLSVPFVNIFMMEGDLINEYLIYADVSELSKSA